jgi:hypothetical protein
VRGPRAWLALALLWLPLAAAAHKPSDSFLVVDLGAAPPTLRWDIALRDLEYAIGVDGDGDGAVTWGELRARHADIAAYALGRLDVEASGAACALTPGAQLVVDHSDGAYTVLPVTLECPAGGAMRLRYRLFFDLDPSHRGLVRVRGPGGERAALLSPDRQTLELGEAPPAPWAAFGEYWREGVWHIWIGFDHVLFLLALLLPSVLWRVQGHWKAVGSLTPALRDVVAVVTAFTVAHSITLTLAALGWVALPARWVESAIAATVVLAALNNLYPLVPGRRWVIAFFLGLVHGLGFASVLGDLGLPRGALLPALAGFNLGVEAGQLAIVAVFVPLAFVLRETRFYRRGALRYGSASVAALALVWLADRSLNLGL